VANVSESRRYEKNAGEGAHKYPYTWKTIAQSIKEVVSRLYMNNTVHFHD